MGNRKDTAQARTASYEGVVGGGATQNLFHTEMCSGSEAGSYLRLVDICITQLWS